MIDQYSDTWVQIKRLIEAKIELNRRELEASGTDQARTEFLRGRIDAFREILALAEPPMPIIKEGGAGDYTG